MLGVLLRNPEFRKLWLAQVISQSGDWLNRVAVLAMIGRLSGVDAAVGMGALFGLELAIRLLPTAFFGPLAGPVADRLPRKALMIGSDLTRTGVVLCFLFVREPGHLPLLYGLLVTQTSLSIFFSSAREASIPNTLPREDLHLAYALTAVTWSTVLALGAVAGGVLVHVVGVRGVFVIDAGTYVASAGLTALVALPPTPRQTEPFRWRDVVLLTELRRALVHARSLHLGPILAAKSFWGAAGGYLVLLAVVANSRFGGAEGASGSEVAAAAGAGAAGFATGMLYGARGVGTGLGPILARRAFGSDDRSLRRQISLGFVVAAVGYGLFAVSHDLWVACAWVVAAHVGGSTIWVASTTYWQRRVEDRFRGRVFALEFLGMTLSFSAGGLIAGWVYDATGSDRTAVWVMSALVLVLGALWHLLARTVPLGLSGDDPVGDHSSRRPTTS